MCLKLLTNQHPATSNRKNLLMNILKMLLITYICLLNYSYLNETK